MSTCAKSVDEAGKAHLTNCSRLSHHYMYIKSSYHHGKLEVVVSCHHSIIYRSIIVS